VRVLWWSCLVIVVLGTVRTVALLLDGLAKGDTATIIVNALLVPVEAAILVVLVRVRDQLRA
jgi:hypothetical protein